MCFVIDNDVRLNVLLSRRKNDEYMNAAAAHAAFVMTVSAASMYWLLRHAQHARCINHHPLTEKIGFYGPLCRFSAQWNRLYIENSRFLRFQSEFFRTSTARSEKINHDFNHENRHSVTGYIEKAVFVSYRFQTRFQSRFSAQWNTPFTQRK